LPIDGPAPAVVNAIRHAGLDVRAIPATPEALSLAPRLKPDSTPRTTSEVADRASAPPRGEVIT
jgi:hypothetical protein